MRLHAAASAEAAPTIEVLHVCVQDQRYALPLDVVVEVLPAMAPVALPGSPPVIAGLISLRGELVPLLDLRARLGLPPSPARAEDHVVVCTIGSRRVGVWVDAAESVTVVNRDAVVPAAQVAAAKHLAGVAQLPDGLLLVSDVGSFLAADEALCLDAAVAAARQQGGS